MIIIFSVSFMVTTILLTILLNRSEKTKLFKRYLMTVGSKFEYYGPTGAGNPFIADKTIITIKNVKNGWVLYNETVYNSNNEVISDDDKSDYIDVLMKRFKTMNKKYNN